MQAFTSLVVVAVLTLAPVPLAAQPLSPEAEAAAFRQVAQAIPLGARIDVRTKDGRRLSATLLALDADRIVVKRRSRVPEPAVGIRFDELARLERHEPGGFGLVKVIGVGLAAGVGAILTVVAIAMSLDD